MRRSRILEKIVRVLRPIKWLKSIGSPIWHKLYVEPLKKYKREVFASDGVELLKQFDVVMKALNIPYSLAFGTLLGAVRDGGFIKNDFDVDVAVWGGIDNLSLKEALENMGFSLYRRIEVDKGLFGREETYVYNDVFIDIFYFYKYDDYLDYTLVFIPYDGCANFNESCELRGGLVPLQLKLPISKTVEYIPFLTIEVPIFTNATEFLEARYGQNWRIPDPTFVYPKMGDVLYEPRYDKVGIIEYLNQEIVL